MIDHQNRLDDTKRLRNRLYKVEPAFLVTPHWGISRIFWVC